MSQFLRFCYLNTNRGRRSLFLVLAALWIGIVAPASAEAPMALDDIITLRKLGFTETQLRAELAPLKGTMPFDEASVSRLTEAGLSTDFIDFMRSLAPEKRLNNDDIARLLGQGASTLQVLREIAASKREFDASAPALLTLNRQVSLPPTVVKAMRGQALSVTEVQQLAESGSDPTEIDLLISMIGMERKALSPSEALGLTKAGLSTDLVARIRESAARADPQAPTKEALSAEDFEHFEHVTGLFKLHYPKDWFFSRQILHGSPTYFASPERNLSKPGAAKTIIALTLSPLARPRNTTPEQLLNVFSALARQEVSGFEPLDAVQTVEHGAYQGFSAKIDDTAIRGRTYALVGRDHVNYLSFRAPTEQFDALATTLDFIASNLNIVTDQAPDAAQQALTSQDVVRRYEEAIVQVRAWNGNEQKASTGTGFFVRADGYLVTNAHVVLDLKTLKPMQNFEVRWPDRMNREPERAELVGVQSPMEGTLSGGWGVGNDMAILRITSTKPLKTIPLVPTDDVSLGDQIVVIGYPLTSLLGAKLETTVTSGVVTRFQRDDDDTVQTIISDVTASGGNSGGPAISLRSGGAVGLLTLASQWHTKTGKASRYSGILPASTLLSFYPEETQVKAGRSQSMDFLDTYDLALRAFEIGSVVGAESVAKRAIQRRPQDANGYGLHAQIALKSAESDEDRETALESLRRALDIDRDHVPSLLTRSVVEMERDDAIAALRYIDRAIAASPNSWPIHYQRAHVNLELKRFDQALEDLERAQRFSGELIPQPFSLAGEAHYEKGEPEKGKALFEKAISLAPNDIDARLGLGRYYIEKDQYANALIEFDRLNTDVPKVPVVLGWTGYAYSLQGNHAKAKDFLWSSFLGFQRNRRITGELPPEFLLKTLGESARKDRDPARAIVAYSRLIQLYEQKHPAEGVIEAREYLAEQAREKHPEVTRLHLVAASRVAREESAELRKRVSEQLEKLKRGSLSLDDIVYMDVRSAYDTRMVAKIILDDDARLGFTVPGGSTSRKTPDKARTEWLNEQREKLKLSRTVLLALHHKARLDSNKPGAKKQPKKDEGVSLIGRWRGPVRDGQAWVFDFQDGKERLVFRLFADVGGKLTERDTGVWRVANNKEGKQVLSLDSEAQKRQVELPLGIGEDKAGKPVLLITFGKDRQAFFSVK